jgi:hypothetical protein
MKKILLFTFFLTLSALCHAQITDPSNVQAVAWFDLGESRIYEYETDRLKIEGIDTLSRLRTVRDVAISVIDSTEVSYTIELSFSNYRTGDTAKNALQNALMNDVKILYMTDELGSSPKIMNLDEVMGEMGHFVDSFESMFVNPDEEMKRSLDILHEEFSNEAIVTARIHKFLAQFHFCHGIAYTLGEIYGGEYESPIIDGIDIMAKRNTSTWLSDISPSMESFTISMSDRIDPESLTKSVASLTATVDERVASELEKMFERGIENNTIGTITLDNRGWVENAVQKVIISFGNMGMEETQTIRVK